MGNLFGVNVAPRFPGDPRTMREDIFALGSNTIVVQDEIPFALECAERIPYVVYRDVDEVNDGAYWKRGTSSYVDPVQFAKARLQRVPSRLIDYILNEPVIEDWQMFTDWLVTVMDVFAQAGRCALVWNAHAGDIERRELHEGKLDRLLTKLSEYRKNIIWGTHSGSYGHLYWGFGQQPETDLLNPAMAQPANWGAIPTDWIEIDEAFTQKISADSWHILTDGQGRKRYVMYPNPLLFGREVVTYLYLRDILHLPMFEVINSEITLDISGPGDAVKRELERHGTSGYGRLAGIQTYPDLYTNFYYPGRDPDDALYDQLAFILSKMPEWYIGHNWFQYGFQERWDAPKEGNGHNIARRRRLLRRLAEQPITKAYPLPQPAPEPSPQPPIVVQPTPMPMPITSTVTVNVPNGSRLNVRRFSAAGAEVVATVRHGDELELLMPCERDVIGLDGEWIRVETRSGVRGRVAAQYVK